MGTATSTPMRARRHRSMNNGGNDSMKASSSPGFTPVRRVAALCLLSGGMLLGGECAARVFWRARGASFWNAPRTIHYSFYPPLARLARSDAGGNDALEILLLGGSVLHNEYGSIEHALKEQLVRATGRAVRIHNLSAAAHTSLDSFFKYRHLAHRRFDLVLVYHGINEVRANNCPSSVFRADYSHWSWYRLLHAYERKWDRRWAALPFTIRFVTFKVLDRLGLVDALPTHRPDPRGMEYGCEVKTAESFRANIEGIVALAKARDEPVVLTTFAYHLPENYSESAFRDRKLDYTTHAFPVELWGRADCVRAALDAHNGIIEAVADSHPQVSVVDQARLLPKTGRFFNDACHLTAEGSQRFVEIALPVILECLALNRRLQPGQLGAD